MSCCIQLCIAAATVRLVISHTRYKAKMFELRYGSGYKAMTYSIGRESHSELQPNDSDAGFEKELAQHILELEF